MISLAFLAGKAARAQWEVLPSTTVDVPTSASYVFACPPDSGDCTVASAGLPFPGYLGNDLAWRSWSWCENPGTACGTATAYGEAQVLIDGVGTSTIRIRWDALARTDFDCCHWHGPCTGPGTCTADASAGITAVINLLVPGPGDTRTVRFRWQQFSANMYDPEVFGADDFGTAMGTLGVAGDAAYGTQYNLINSRGWWLGSGNGRFTLTTGMVIPIDITALTSASIAPPHKSTNICEYDSESTAWGGQIELVVDGWPAVGECDWVDAEQELEFSIDIGSDAELSDPTLEMNEVFDPGDMYLWQRPPLLPGGEDGFRDDLITSTADPLPDAPDGPPAVTGAPTCSFLPPGSVAAEWFDVDGSDALDFDIRTVPGYALGSPFPAPVMRFPSSCVYAPWYLVVSYDDDSALHYVGCDVPSTATSPLGASYGSVPLEDEVFGLYVAPGATPVAAAAYPLASEEDLHASLIPGPLGPIEDPDDDVDALDCTPVIGDTSGCPYWYFSADHEATGGRIPGAIYLAGAVAPVLVPTTHLGLPLGVDIDAVEFVWTPVETGAEFLTLLFSVDDDDPLTPADESGGLDPRMIYASYLDGFWFTFLAAPLADDVDAIAACCEPIGDRRIVPGDMNCDGVVNFGDINPFVLYVTNCAAWQAAFPGCALEVGDIDGDGQHACNGYLFDDINAFVALLAGS